MDPEFAFWHEIGQLIAANRIVIDRPKGVRHLRYPASISPFDVGYMENTSARDAG